VSIITPYRGYLPENEGTKIGNVRLINANPKETWKDIGRNAFGKVHSERSIQKGPFRKVHSERSIRHLSLGRKPP
jgi:hypothetical protein